MFLAGEWGGGCWSRAHSQNEQGCGKMCDTPSAKRTTSDPTWLLLEPLQQWAILWMRYDSIAYRDWVMQPLR